MSSIDENVLAHTASIDKYLDEALSILMRFSSDILSGKSTATDSNCLLLETYLVGLTSWKLNYSSVMSVLEAASYNKSPGSVVETILNSCKTEFSFLHTVGCVHGFKGYLSDPTEASSAELCILSIPELNPVINRSMDEAFIDRLYSVYDEITHRGRRKSMDDQLLIRIREIKSKWAGKAANRTDQFNNAFRHHIAFLKNLITRSERGRKLVDQQEEEEHASGQTATADLEELVSEESQKGEEEDSQEVSEVIVSEDDSQEMSGVVEDEANSSHESEEIGMLDYDTLPAESLQSFLLVPVVTDDNVRQEPAIEDTAFALPHPKRPRMKKRKARRRRQVKAIWESQITERKRGRGKAKTRDELDEDYVPGWFPVS